MKKILLLTCISLVCLTCFGQSAIHDVMTLKRYLANSEFSPDNYKTADQLRFEKDKTYVKGMEALFPTLTKKQIDSISQIDKMATDNLKIIKGEKIDTLSDIFTRYFPGIDIRNADIATKVIQQNPFFKNLEIKGTTIGEIPVKGISSVFSSIGGLDVTNIADGLARFLVKRAKQELSMAFFDKLKKVIDETPDLKTLFPQTSELLSAMGEEVYNYEAYIQNLREAFKEDIQAIPLNFPGIIDNHKKDYFEKHQALEAALRSACYITNALQDKTHPGDILENFPIQYLDSVQNYKGAIQTLQLFSISFRNTDETDSATYWVSLKKVKELVSDKIAFQIYLGLIYQKAKTDSISFDNNIFLFEILKKAADEFNKYYNPYKRFIEGFALKLDLLNGMVKTYSKPATDSLALELYAKYFKSSVDMIEYCVSVSDLPFFPVNEIGNFHNLLKPYFKISHAAVDLAISINRKNYSAAINHAVYIYNETIAKNHKVPQVSKASKNIDRKIKKIKNISTGIGLAADDIKLKVDSISGEMNDNPKKTLYNFLKYGSFMASVATAKNSEEVSAAIEAFALPAGSSRIKRRSDFNVSLNAYVGLFVGMEKIKSVDSGFTPNTFGVYAPVGISMSRGNISLGKWKGHSISLFISAIDLGAVTSFRFKDDSTKKAPAIKLKDIFAPGVNLSFGFANSPISLSAGWQMGPRLRGVTPAANEFASSKYSRIGITLCVDIPLFNFFTKSK